MSSRWVGIAAVVLATATMAAGCGDDGSSDAQSSSDVAAVPPVKTSQLSKVAYLKTVNAECGRLRKNVMVDAAAYLAKLSGGAPAPLGSDKEAKANAKLGRVVIVPTVEKEMAAIRKQGAPAGDEEEIESLLAAEQQGVDEVKRLKQTESIQDILDRFAAATKALQKYGLTGCGN